METFWSIISGGLSYTPVFSGGISSSSLTVASAWCSGKLVSSAMHSSSTNSRDLLASAAPCWCPYCCSLFTSPNSFGGKPAISALWISRCLYVNVIIIIIWLSSSCYSTTEPATTSAGAAWCGFRACTPSTRTSWWSTPCFCPCRSLCSCSSPGWPASGSTTTATDRDRSSAPLKAEPRSGAVNHSSW